jgi:hypothetical protein
LPPSVSQDRQIGWKIQNDVIFCVKLLKCPFGKKKSIQKTPPKNDIVLKKEEEEEEERRLRHFTQEPSLVSPIALPRDKSATDSPRRAKQLSLSVCFVSPSFFLSTPSSF